MEIVAGAGTLPAAVGSAGRSQSTFAAPGEPAADHTTQVLDSVQHRGESAERTLLDQP
jgi:hypothetical protein